MDVWSPSYDHISCVKVNVNKVNVKVNVNKVNDNVNDIYSPIISFVVAMNRVDFVDLVIDLVDMTLTLTLLTLILTLTLLTLFLVVGGVALRAASILKKHDFLYLFNFLNVAKLFYLLGFEPRE